MPLKKTGEKITIILMKKEVNEPYREEKVLKLEIQDDNVHDKDAIKALLDGEYHGQVANNPSKTLLPDTKSATEIKDFIGKRSAYAKVDIASLKEIGSFAYQYVAEVMIEEAAATKKKAEIEFTLGGGLTTYPGKSSLQKAASKGEVQITLKQISDKIVAMFNETEAGYVKAEEEDINVLMQYVEDLPGGLTAKAYEVDKGNVKCKITLQKQVAVKTVDLDKAIDRVINEDIMSKEEVEERLEYLMKCKVSKKVIANMFQTCVKYPDHVKARIIKPETLYVDTDGIVAKVVGYMNLGKNLRFEGERGVGKNVLAETMAWVFYRPFWEFGSNSQHSNHSIIGKDTFKSETPEEKEKNKLSFLNVLRWLLPKKELNKDVVEGIGSVFSKLSGGNKELVFQKSMIIEALEYGGVIILDEFNSGLADVLTILNSVLDDRRRIDIQGYGQVIAHKNFLAISTENKNYAGTFQMHEGTIDRFTPIVFPKPQSIINVLQAKVPNVNYDTILQVGSFYNKLKSSVEDGILGENTSTVRGFITACEAIEQDISLKVALIDNVANRADDLSDREAIRDLINLSFRD